MIQNSNMAHIKIADTFFQKLFGLMFKKDCTYHLLLKKCTSIHTFFMFFNIDCVFLDKANNVISIRTHIQPGHIIIGPLGTHSIIELKTNRETTKIYSIGLHVPIPNVL